MPFIRLCLGALLTIACGTSQGLSPKAADEQLDKLIVLYEENRPKFVVQKQEMIQNADCARAQALRAAADRKMAQAAMSPEDSTLLTQVQMEMQQAASECAQK